MAIDSHMHINSVVVGNTQENIRAINEYLEIESVINVGLDITTSKESILISRENPKFYSVIGIHPLYTDSQEINILLQKSSNMIKL